jgi:hypothetical protein
VDTEHVGWLITPITGIVGVAGCVLITATEEDNDVHPSELVTVKEYVPAPRPDIVVPVPEPVVIAPPGLLVNVQVPVDGKLLKTTLPVATAHVGCVIAPMRGEAGVTGGSGITTFKDAGDVQPASLVTV